MHVKGVKCISVEVGSSVYGPGSQTGALKRFFENPVGEVTLNLFDKSKVKIEVEDEKLVLTFF
jgi:hypothetical protein